MSIELWLGFVAASAILLLLPGPTILTVVSDSVAHGRRGNATPYAVFAASARRLPASAAAQRRFNLTGGALPSAAGVGALLARRAG